MSYVTKVARWHCNWCPRTYSTQRAGDAHEERCPENPKRQMSALEYFVVAPRVISGPEAHFIIYESDRKTFDDRKKAVSHGYATYGSDDFLIATLSGGKLAASGWMEKDRDPADDEELESIATTFGLERVATEDRQ